MNKEIKEKWIAALRSGEYAQTKGALRRPVGTPQGAGYCCLGVLCEVVVGRENIEWEPAANAYSFMGESGLPPTPVLEEADYTEEENDTFWELPSMNDNGVSFDEIADYIEQKL
jgi:hypothetical protein